MRGVGLRLRIVLPVAVVLVVALIVLGAYTQLAVRVEFEQFLRTRDETLSASAPELSPERIGALERALREGGWTSVARRLAEAPPGAEPGPDLILLDGDRTVRLVDSEWIRPGDIVRRGDGLRIEAERRGTAVVLVVPAEGQPLRAEDGSLLGSVVVLDSPEEGPVRDSEVRDFAGRVGRGALAAAVVLALLALGFTWWAVSRALAPVEALREAVQAVAAGKLSRRVSTDREDEIGRLAAAFNSMAASLERGERLRRDMVADVAHELRTPLTALRCQLEALQDGLAEPAPERIDSLHEEVVVLARLVEDLQLLAEAEAGTLQIERLPLDLRAEVAVALEGIRAAHGDGLEIEASELGSYRVIADPVRLRQVLRNLLSNALTHGAPPVEIRAEGVGDAVRIEVVDSGPGLESEALERVFDRFYRADPSRARDSGGSGIGLPIVRRLVEAMGGETGVRSRPGGGATFWFTLPVGDP